MSDLRILHTADWHAGRTLHGTDRTPAIRTALERMVEKAIDLDIDLAVVAGDVFDTPSPGATAEGAVANTFLALSEAGIPSVVIAGNHDSPARLDALARLYKLADVHVIGTPRTAGEGGAFEVATRHGPTVSIAAVPWVSQRRILRSDHLARLAPEERFETYQQGMSTLIRNLTSGMIEGDTNLLIMHGTMAGAAPSGTEFAFHSGNAYVIEPAAIPSVVSYTALGHIHEPQSIRGTLGEYPGSLVQLDFGEADRERGFQIVRFSGGQAIASTFHAIEQDAPLRILDTTPDRLEHDLAYVRDQHGLWKVRVDTDRPQHGLKDQVHRDASNVIVVEVRLPEHEAPEPERIDLAGIDLREAFIDYMRDQRGREPDPDLLQAFDHAEKADEEAKEAEAA